MVDIYQLDNGTSYLFHPNRDQWKKKKKKKRNPVVEQIGKLKE